MKKLNAFILFTLLSLSAQAKSVVPPSLLQIPAPAGMKALAMTTDEQGFIYVAGSVMQPIPQVLPRVQSGADFSIAKLNANGTLIWQTNQAMSLTGNEDRADQIMVKNGKVYVTGSALEGFLPPAPGITSTNYLHKDVAILKLNAATGAVEMNSRIANQWPYFGQTINTHETVSYINIDAQGNLYVTGVTGLYPDYYYGLPKGERHWFTSKITPNGSIAWQTFGKGDYIGGSLTSYNFPVKSFIDTNTSSIYIFGSYDMQATYMDYHVQVLDLNDGHIKKEKYLTEIRSSHDQLEMLYDVVKTKNGFYLWGTLSDGTQLPYYSPGLSVVKLDLNLNLIGRGDWMPALTDSTNPRKILIGKDGDFYVSGIVATSASTLANIDIFTSKISSTSLQTTWTHTVDGPLNMTDLSTDMSLDCKGNIWSLANMNVHGLKGDIQTQVLNSNGSVLSTKTFDGEKHGADQPLASALTKDYYFVLARASNTTPGPNDSVILRYPASNRCAGPQLVSQEK